MLERLGRARLSAVRGVIGWVPWPVLLVVAVLIAVARAGTSGAALEPAAGAGQALAALPPDAPQFDVSRRTQLARSILQFTPADTADFVDDGVYLLPVPLLWPPASPVRSWELNVPGGVPLFLVAGVAPAKTGFATAPTVTVDGVSVTNVAAYAVDGIALPDGAAYVEHRAIGIVIPPPPPGHHTVRVTCAGCAPSEGPWLSVVNGAERKYTLHVGLDPEALQEAMRGISACDCSADPAAAAVEPAAAMAVPSAQPAEPAQSTQPAPGAAAPGTPGGTVIERRVYSPALQKELPYRVYLPAGYDAAPESGLRYPVAVLLHGLGANERQWSTLGLEAELDRQGAQFIAVMPAGRTGYWTNHAGGGPRWADYVAHDLVAHVDATYRTLGIPEARAIGGISMGGYGALQLALTQPALFGVAGAHSPALRPRHDAPFFLGGMSLVPPAVAPPPQAYAERDPITLATRSAVPRPPALWIDAGEGDPWLGRTRELHTTLNARGWQHAWQPGAGGHDSAYWTERLSEYIGWYRAQLEPRLQRP